MGAVNQSGRVLQPPHRSHAACASRVCVRAAAWIDPTRLPAKDRRPRSSSAPFAARLGRAIGIAKASPETRATRLRRKCAWACVQALLPTPPQQSSLPCSPRRGHDQRPCDGVGSVDSIDPAPWAGAFERQPTPSFRRLPRNSLTLTLHPIITYLGHPTSPCPQDRQGWRCRRWGWRR